MNAQQPPSVIPSSTPIWARWIAGVPSAAIAVSGAVFMILGCVADAKPVFTLVGFETIAMISGVVGVLVATGRLKEGPALAFAMIAGVVFAGTVLGYLSATGQRDFLRPNGKLGSIPMGLWLHGRVLATLALGAVATLMVLTRDRRSIGLFIRGVICGVPVLLLLLALWKFGLGGGGQHGNGEVVRIVGVLVGGVLALALISASGHYLIRAFEVSRDPLPPSGT